jgi:hypothetical protein
MQGLYLFQRLRGESFGLWRIKEKCFRITATLFPLPTSKVEGWSVSTKIP